MKKLLAITIVFLFFVMIIFPTGGIQIQNKHIINSNRGNTLYVGGSGPGNYTKIQDAIDNASDGDTVFVYDDSSPYYETIVIDKQIKLIGEDRHTTIIDGDGDGNVVLIEEGNDGVDISGFTVQGSGIVSPGFRKAGIYISSNFNAIHDNNIINNNDSGIIVFLDSEDTYYNSIYGNTVKNNREGIIIIDSFEYNIFDNNISNNWMGIFCTPSVTPNQAISCSSYTTGKIYRNNFTNNSCGIYEAYWGGEDIYDNNIINNYNGIYLWAMYEYCGGNNIYNNNIIKNDEGIGIKGSIDNHIYQNNIINNKEGINIEGDMTGGSHDNKIYKNNFIGNLNYNARDCCDNQWDNGSTGNYWDDYTGVDNDEDGIGDSPYRLRPYLRGNKDRYPLMEPYYEGFDPDAPNAPNINGPHSGIPGVEYNYTFVATDPNDDEVYYYIIWSDGTFEEWIGPYTSGEIITLNHSWNKKDTYPIVARAKDSYGAEGPWGKLIVTIPRDKSLSYSLLLRFLERYPLLNRLLNIVK